MTDSHLTIEWLKMFLLREITPTYLEHSHLVGCNHCMQLLAQASNELAEMARSDVGEGKHPLV